jgi:sugar/nucleoside kinase (ribokinase family)
VVRQFFSAGFTVALLEGVDLWHAARFANAVGALAVTKKGPMEGVPTREDMLELMAWQSSS